MKCVIHTYIIQGTCIHCCYVYTCCSLDKSLPCRISPRCNEGVCFLWTRFRADLATRSLARYHENLKMPSPMPNATHHLKEGPKKDLVSCGGLALGGIPLDLDSHDFTELGDSIVERTTMKTNNQDVTVSSALGKSGNVFEQLGLCSSSKRTIGFISEVHCVDLSPPKKCASP